MKKVLIGLFILTAAMNVAAQKTTKTTTKTAVKTTAKPATPAFKSLLDSFSYVAGFNVATNMKAQSISKINAEMMQKGIDDAFKNKQSVIATEAANACMQKQLEAFAAEKGVTERAAGIAFLETNKKRQGIITLPSGVQYEIIKSGDPVGDKVAVSDTVIVNYAGSTIDGKEFESSFKRGEPLAYPVMGFMKGWTEILQLMRIGDHWKVYIPSDLAYGAAGAGTNIPPHAALIFEIVVEGIRPALKQ